MQANESHVKVELSIGKCQNVMNNLEYQKNDSIECFCKEIKNEQKKSNKQEVIF